MATKSARYLLNLNFKATRIMSAVLLVAALSALQARASTVTITMNPTTPTWAQMPTISANISPSQTTTVTFKAFGIQQGNTKSITNSTFASSDALGPYTVGQTIPFTATLSDNTTSNTLNVTIAKVTPGVTCTSNANPSSSNQSVTFTATVQGSSNVSIGSSGTVDFLIDGAPAPGGTGIAFSGGTTPNKTATFTTSTLSVGSHTIAVKFNAVSDSNYLSNASTATLLTQTVNAGIGAAKLKFTISPTATINTSTPFTITAQDANNNTVTNYNGTIHMTRTGPASVSIAQDFALTNGVSVGATVIFFTAGTYQLLATDSVNGTSVSSGDIIVTNGGGGTGTPATPTVTLSSSANPATLSTAVNLTATCSGTSGTPTGTVTFTIDGAQSGTAKTLVAGVASLSISTLTAGTHTVSAQYSGDSAYAAATGTLSGGQQITTASLLSAATAAPNPANVQQSVVFLVGAVGTVTWDFGDGTTGSGVTTTHAYLAAGTYTAVASISDGVNAAIKSSVIVTVNATPPVTVPPVIGTGTDSDGDGFSDAIELLAGTNPLLASSTPSGAAITAALIKPLTVSRVLVKLTFSKPAKDSIMFSGTVDLGTLGLPKTAVVDVGGVSRAFILDAKGKAKIGGESFQLSANSTPAKYKVNLTKGTFAETLAVIGLTNTNETIKTVVIPFTIALSNQIVVRSKLQMTYSAKINKTGTAK